MKRLLSLLVTGSLLITPVLAAQTDVESSFPALREPAAFGDVADDIWYADAAGLCYVTGLLNGTGNGNFSPSRSVTIGEAATLAGRIHHILSGGDGTLPEAPEEWGQLTLTRADGTSARFHQNSETGFWLDEKSIQLYFNLDESWKAAEGQTVTLTLNGTDYAGTLTESGEGRFAFQLSDPTRDYENYTADLWDALWRPAPGNWSRNTAHYLETVLHTGPDQISGLGETATRLDFVKLLSLVSGDLLESINDITDFPDATEETKNLVLPFYQAGILTGTDDYGTFRATGTLSRAEMATMAARLIRPELRQEFTLKTVDDSRYTLTPLDLKGGKADGDWATSSLLPVTYEDHWALYRADGTWYTPEEGMVFLDANEDGLVMMQAADDTYAVVDSTRDWSAVPFTPNWSCKLLGDGNFISQASYDADPILHDRTGAAIATLTGDGHWDVLSDGLAPCLDESARLYGFVDTKGEWVIPAQYIEVKYFRDGYAAVKQEGGWGVIDTTGKLVIPCAQPSLEHRGGPWFYSSSGQWLAADGSAVPAAASSYNGQNITLTGDYFPCGTYYLDRNFQPVTPQIFDWTGPVDENGCAFVGLDGATYRITLKA